MKPAKLSLATKAANMQVKRLDPVVLVAVKPGAYGERTPTFCPVAAENLTACAGKDALPIIIVLFCGPAIVWRTSNRQRRSCR